ncbi:MAG: hypothetical protein AAGA21_14740 [Pseudomonadota bacterium]
MARMFDEDFVRTALEKAWSLDSAVQWSAENPANGQCNVTAAVIHDLFGGEILRTRYPSVWHYYNRIDGRRVDLTDSQFSRPGARFSAPERYDDEVSDRDAAMEGIQEREYDALRKALLLHLG